LVAELCGDIGARRSLLKLAPIIICIGYAKKNIKMPGAATGCCGPGTGSMLDEENSILEVRARQCGKRPRRQKRVCPS
jgi:hypothetical protein